MSPLNPASNNIGNTVLLSLNKGLMATIAFVPNFIAGLVLLLIGILLGSVLRRVFYEVLMSLKIEAYLHKYGIPEAKKEFSWTNIIAEIIRWFVIILFLIPTAEVWQMPQIVTVLNQFLFYLPNVFVAAIIGIVGLIFARLAYDIILASTRQLSRGISKGTATTAKWAITVFVFLAVLNQLGVAQDLIRILFTGFVAMVALAGGIAFGLGGKGVAADILESLYKKFK